MAANKLDPDAEAALVGWIVMGSTTQPYTFPERERRVYPGLADLAAIAIRNFQLLDLADQRARRAQLVGKISARVRETLDMDLILQTALREIGESLGISSIEVQIQRRVTGAHEDDGGEYHGDGGGAMGAPQASGDTPEAEDGAETEQGAWEA
ncbi:MAG: hypothetical protein JXC32_18145, partial [Anaerolineae bacterium]|nr:hypothetical protein [Anaerolineae bacterium]